MKLTGVGTEVEKEVDEPEVARVDGFWEIQYSRDPNLETLSLACSLLRWRALEPEPVSLAVIVGKQETMFLVAKSLHANTQVD